MDELIKELGYWPSRGAFIREAALDKIQKERKLLKELRDERRDLVS
jgi:Arc/MetJ-type ribon-helix-helix transcriptional regulator